MNLSNIDITNTNPVDELQGFFKSTAKAILVASDATATEINNLLSAFGEAYFVLLPELFPIQQARTERNIQNDLYDKHQEEVSRITASMIRFNEEAKVDSSIWDALSSSLAFNMEQSDTAAKARQNAWSELNRLKLEFSRTAYIQFKDVAMTMPAVLGAIRSELDLETDIDKYTEELEQRYARVNELMEGLYQEISNDAA